MSVLGCRSGMVTRQAPSQGRQRIGDPLEILVDSGVRHGSNVAVAIAEGADAVLLGRPHLYGLGAGGRAGVTKVLELLDQELVRTLELLGVTSVEQLRSKGSGLVRRGPHRN